MKVNTIFTFVNVNVNVNGHTFFGTEEHLSQKAQMILSLLLSLIFFILGAIHFNWVFGGKFGFTEALPIKESGERILNPRKIDSAIVGIGLSAFALLYFLRSGIVDYDLPEWLLKYAGWIIPSIFILRAIGDFKYIGLFKKVKTTEFGKRDTKLFSPLCLIIAILAILIQLK